MAYSITNPPVLFQQLHPAGARMWYYKSADANTLVRVSGYFTNGAIPVAGQGGPVGMKDQDWIFVQVSTTGLITSHIVFVSAAGVVDLSDALAVTTVTNSD